jgi:hypothetical protein
MIGRRTTTPGGVERHPTTSPIAQIRQRATSATRGDQGTGCDTTTIEDIDSDDDEWMAAHWEQEDPNPGDDDEDMPQELSQDSDEFFNIINRVENLVGKRRATIGIRARARMLV